MSAEFLLSRADGYGIAVPTQLHEDTIEAMFRAHKSGDANHRFIAKHAGFHLGSILEARGHRTDSLFQEEEVLNRTARHFQVIEDRQLNASEMKTTHRIRIQMLQQQVLELSCHEAILRGS